MKPVVHFVHGKESGPWGSKITYLADIARANECEVDSLDYSGIDDPHARAERLVGACAAITQALILVGSSMGGWVATAASTRVKTSGLFLLAPAFDLPGYPEVSPGCASGRIEIVHGWRDDVIPFSHSVEFGRRHACPVHLVEDDHRLGGTLESTGEYFGLFLRRIRC